MSPACQLSVHSLNTEHYQLPPAHPWGYNGRTSERYSRGRVYAHPWLSGKSPSGSSLVLGPCTHPHHLQEIPDSSSSLRGHLPTIGCPFPRHSHEVVSAPGPGSSLPHIPLLGRAGSQEHSNISTPWCLWLTAHFASLTLPPCQCPRGLSIIRPNTRWLPNTI